MDGKLFRQLRKDRGLRLQDVADEVNSVSFISKFEKENSNISFYRLEHLLEQINVSLEEFLYLRDQAAEPKLYHYLSEQPFFMTGKFTFYLNQIFKSNDEVNASRDFNQGVHQMRELSQTFTEKNRGEKFLKLLCQLLRLCYQLNDRREQEEPIKLNTFFDELQTLSEPVVNYLYNVENWGVFEVLLFCFFQFSFPVETVHQLLRTAVSRIEKEVGVQLMQRMKFELLFGTCATFINFQKLTWAKEVLVETEKLLHDQGDLLNSTKLLFYQGWVKIISGSLKSGKQNCEQAISIFRILKQPTMQRMYEEMLQGIMINQANQEDFIIFS